MRPLATVFYATFGLAVCWHAPRAIDGVLAQFAPPRTMRIVSADAWWQTQWRTLPAHRDERSARDDTEHGGPLDLQIAGTLADIRTRFEAQGWRVQTQADWIAVLGLLDASRAPRDQPVLPATLDAQAESLLMRRAGPTADTQQVLRLWPAPAMLADGRPLWLGGVQTMRFARPVRSFGVWLPVDDRGASLARAREALLGLEQQEAPHPDGGLPVLRAKIEAR